MVKRSLIDVSVVLENEGGEGGRKEGREREKERERGTIFEQ